MSGEMKNRPGAVGIALAASALVHLGLYALLGDEPPPRKVNEAVEFELIEPPPPPPPEPEPIAEPEPEPEPVKPEPQKVARVDPPPQKTPTPPPPANTPPPNEPPPPDARPAPIKIGISLSSTTQGGGFAVGTGNSVYGKVDPKAADPKDVKPYAPGPDTKQAPFVPASRLTKQPSLRGTITGDLTPEAKREGIEGTVVVRIKIDEKGRVVEAKVVQGLGYGLDENAIKALRAAKFSPASVDGNPVVTEINFRINFLLE